MSNRAHRRPRRPPGIVCTVCGKATTLDDLNILARDGLAHFGHRACLMPMAEGLVEQPPLNLCDPADRDFLDQLLDLDDDD